MTDRIHIHSQQNYERSARWDAFFNEGVPQKDEGYLKIIPFSKQKKTSENGEFSKVLIK